jgi:hypothetical protein
MRGFPQISKTPLFGLKVTPGAPICPPRWAFRSAPRPSRGTSARARACSAAPSAPRSSCNRSSGTSRGTANWNVELRCPECEWWGRESFSQDEVDAYDEELDRGGQELIEDLRALTQANMEEEADRFDLALANDRILPEDF